MKYCWTCINKQRCEAVEKVGAYLDATLDEVENIGNLQNLPGTPDREKRQYEIDKENAWADYEDFKAGWQKKAIERGCHNLERSG